MPVLFSIICQRLILNGVLLRALLKDGGKLAKAASEDPVLKAVLDNIAYQRQESQRPCVYQLSYVDKAMDPSIPCKLLRIPQRIVEDYCGQDWRVGNKVDNIRGPRVSEAQSRDGYRKYFTRASSEGPVKVKDWEVASRISYLTVQREFRGKSMDEIMEFVISALGYTIDPKGCLYQHFKHAASNWRMGLVEAVGDVEFLYSKGPNYVRVYWS
ncbi:hypothetical protein M8818_004132 [Zalaria obscura]|uniref:Uncharacterized protein n=1 Tax=Zalaria obscura TaxID=2024903 RepID=A0ACC3SDA4_9PEZI